MEQLQAVDIWCWKWSFTKDNLFHNIDSREPHRDLTQKFSQSLLPVWFPFFQYWIFPLCYDILNGLWYTKRWEFASLQAWYFTATKAIVSIPLVVALVLLKSYSWNFLIGCPLPRTKRPWCPFPFKNVLNAWKRPWPDDWTPIRDDHSRSRYAILYNPRRHCF